MTHTPGPWIADDYEVRTESGKLIAEVNHVSDGVAISALPDLLQALELCSENLIDDCQCDVCLKLTATVNAAMAKAKGLSKAE